MLAQAIELWDRLDAAGPAEVVWPRSVASIATAADRDVSRAVVLLGAFDPLTNAHVAIARGAARAEHAPPALCLTKILLARSDDALLTPRDRIGVILRVADRCDIGVAFANRGTYLEVGRAMRRSGIDATFVVGADKLGQLADPSFYQDGTRGVDSTFDELRFVVVPRDGIDVMPFLDRANVRVLETSQVFEDDSLARVAASEVRRSVRAGEVIDHLVPSEVAEALRGYTSAR